VTARRRAPEVTPDQYALLCGLFEAAWHHEVPASLADVAPFTSAEARRLAMLAIDAVDAEIAPARPSPPDHGRGGGGRES
jgi:hypothetical protein